MLNTNVFLSYSFQLKRNKEKKEKTGYAGFREDARVLKWVRFCDFEFSHYLCDFCCYFYAS